MKNPNTLLLFSLSVEADKPYMVVPHIISIAYLSGAVSVHPR